MRLGKETQNHSRIKLLIHLKSRLKQPMLSFALWLAYSYNQSSFSLIFVRICNTKILHYNMMQQTECNPNLKPINSQTLFMCCCASW